MPGVELVQQVAVLGGAVAGVAPLRLPPLETTGPSILAVLHEYLLPLGDILTGLQNDEA